MDTAVRVNAGRALAIFGLMLMTLLAASAAARADAPANDAFAGATPLPATLPSSEAGSNYEATKEAGEPNHAGNPGGHSVWFSWTPTSSGPVGIQNGSCFGAIDPLIAVYTGPSVDSLSPVASNASPSSPSCFFSELPVAEFEAAAGTTYWIAVDGRNGTEGNFQIQFNQPPSNDDFGSAATIPADPPQSMSGTTRLADKETGEPDHAGDPGGHSVWFNWTPASSGPVEISTCSAFSGLDAVLGVYTGSAVDSLTPVAANDDGPSPDPSPGCSWIDSEVAFEAVAGTTYRIAVDGASGSVGRYTLRVRGRPQNDDFDSPQTLSPSLPSSINQVSNERASEETGEPDHAGDPGGSSVWFSWTPTSSGPVAISTCGPESDLDTVLAAYTGSDLATLTPVAANDDAAHPRCGEKGSEVRFTATAGTTYRIAVDGKGGTQARFDLLLETRPANDAFANAQALPDDLPISTSGSTRFASQETGEPDHAGDPGGSSVWFDWTPASSGFVLISTCPYTESGPDTLLAVYTGSAVGGLTLVAADDDSPSACRSFGSEVGFQAVAGTTYRIAVDRKGGAEGIFGLDINGPPGNDAFAAPQVLGSEPMTAGGSTTFATKEAGEPNHGGHPGGHSLWFSWTPVTSGPVVITACGVGNDVDTLLAVYTGSSLPALTPVAGNDDTPTKPSNEFCGAVSSHSEVEFQAVAGTTYRIAADTKGGEGRVGLAFERAPFNDAFAVPYSLPSNLPSTASAVTRLASKQAGEPNHAGNSGGHSLWYAWTAANSGPVAVSTCSYLGGLDTLLAVYTGSSLGGLAPVAADDDGSTNQSCRDSDSEATFTATAGTTYRIAIDGKAGSTGGFQLFVEGTAANDDFGKPQALGGTLPVRWSFASNRFAGKQAGEPDHAGDSGGSSVWFKWTAPRSGPVSVDTCGSGFDTLLAVYTGATFGSLTPVAGNDDGNGKCAPQSKLSFEAVANTVYRIAVDGKGGNQGGLDLRIGSRPANDDFAAAPRTAEPVGWYWPGTTLLATKESGEPDHAGDAGGSSVWFAWTPRKSGAVELDACTDTFDLLLAVYTGSELASLTPVAATDAGLGECEEGRSLRLNVLAGTTYRIAVDGAGGDDGHFQLHTRPVRSVTPPPPPDPDPGDGDGGDGGGAIPSPPVGAPPAATPPPVTSKPKPKPKKCKRGFKKKTVKGKPRCVKKKKKQKQRRR